MPFQLRSPAEKADLLASWARPDEDFFAAGACHILAGTFLAEHAPPGFSAYLLEPAPGFRGGHVIAADETTTFDSLGYRCRRERMALLEQERSSVMPGWRYSLVAIPDPLGWHFCRQYRHRHPTQFPHDVLARAKRFLSKSLLERT